MDTIDLQKLADDIIAGRRLTREDDLSFFIDADLTGLCSGADRIRAALVGDFVNLCTIINGKSGKCGENCKFCAQSAHHHTSCDIYDLLDADTILAAAKSNESEGVRRFSIVDSGHGPSDADFEKIIDICERVHRECTIKLCVSLGFMTDEQFRRLAAAGVTRIHNNIETSRRYFPHICTTHTFDDKLANIRRAKAAGLEVCSGCIIGMGETPEDRIDIAVTLSELGVVSIPINSLMPIPGTPLEHQRRLTEDEILRCVATFRYINPEIDIRLAGGRALMSDNGIRTFTSGASASITGNMLTTSGSTIQSDMAMLKGLGRKV